MVVLNSRSGGARFDYGNTGFLTAVLRVDISTESQPFLSEVFTIYFNTHPNIKVAHSDIITASQRRTEIRSRSFSVWSTL